MSVLQRDGYVPVALPFDHELAHERVLATVDDLGRKSIAARSRAVGDHSVIFHVFHNFDTSQTGSVKLSKHGKPEAVPDKFAAHPWVADDPSALLVRPVVVVDGRRYSLDSWTPTVVRENYAEQTWHVAGQIAELGLVWNCWMTFGTMHTVADFKCSLAWSDRHNDERAVHFDEIWLQSGEPIALDNARAIGAQQTSTQENNGVWSLKLSGRRGMYDGGALPIWGRMMCTPIDPADLSKPQFERDVRNNYGAVPGPLHGVLSDVAWNGHWMALGTAPICIDENGALATDAAQFDFNRFLEERRTDRDFYEDRQLGLGPYPGRTGAQDDFEVQPGCSAVGLGDPRWLELARYGAMTEFYRGLMHYEANGTVLRADDHPLWTTWSGRTHDATAEDLLGKRKWPAEIWAWEQANGGWKGIDNNHRSNDKRQAYVALTGCDMFLHLMEHQVETDRAANNELVGSARSAARRFGSWAQDLRLLPKSQRDALLNGPVRTLISAVKRGWRGGMHGNAVKIIGYISDEQRYGVIQPENEGVTNEAGREIYEDAFPVWEHGLMVIGYAQLVAVLERLGHQELADDLALIAHQSMESLCKFAVYETSERLLPFDVLWYPNAGTADEGKPLGAELRTAGSWAGPHNPNGPSGVSHWFVAGVSAWRESIQTRYQTDPVAVENADRMIREFGLDAPAVFDSRRPHAWINQAGWRSVDFVARASS